MSDRSEADCVSNDQVERVARAMCEAMGSIWNARNFNETDGGEEPEEQREHYRFLARAAIAAALNAWPGSYSLAENDSAEIRGVAAIILPLPQEPRDE